MHHRFPRPRGRNSVHKHSSGEHVEIGHIGCNLYVDPNPEMNLTATLYCFSPRFVPYF
jgi:hypothetical protein